MSSPSDVVEIQMDGRQVLMERAMADLAKQPPIRVTVDGVKVEVPRVSVSYDPTDRAVPRLTTIYDAAARAGVTIPTLCHREYMNPVAVCRVCAVCVGYEDGRKEPRLSPACYRPVEPGMVISTHHSDARVKTSISMLTELLLADHPIPCAKHREHHDCELELLGEKLGVKRVRTPRAPERRAQDGSSLVIAVDHNACILCDRCIRGCNDIRNNQVIGRRGKGYQAGIAFDLNDPMGDSSCVACGECMVSCPTGALVNRTFVRPEPWDKETPPAKPVSADDLAKHPLFEGIAHAFLRWNEGAVVRRRFKKGDIICREGEYGSTAFYLEKGSVDIFIEAAFKHVKGRKNRRRGDPVDRGFLGLIRRFTSVLVSRNEDDRDEESTRRYIPIDAPVPLSYDDPVATLGPGEIFGEMTCMNFYPRSATVRAAEDCIVLEMLRNVLYLFQRNKKSRALLEEKYRQHAIENHLRAVPLFTDLLEDTASFTKVVDFLRPRVDLLRLSPGQVVFRQGDPADSFYLIRTGFLKVTQNNRGGEHVLTYLGPGKYFGELALLSHLPEVRSLAPAGLRSATCTALDHVDLLRIKGDDFRQLVHDFPQVQTKLVNLAKKYLEHDQRVQTEVESVSLGEFLDQGLMHAQSLLVLDLEKCTRCDECTKACADSHDGVTRLVREGLRFDKYLVATSCRSCIDPYCMVGCPVGSIRRCDSREIIIEDWCIGCGKCADNCPYGNINMHPFPTGRYTDDPDRPGKKVAVVQQKATTCDLCRELDGQPSCVYACPHDAAHRMGGEELLTLVKKECG